ncbi:unnamed protein product [Ixodes pacificus]
MVPRGLNSLQMAPSSLPLSWGCSPTLFFAPPWSPRLHRSTRMALHLDLLLERWEL